MLLRRSFPWLALALAATVGLPSQGAGCSGKTACLRAKGSTCPSVADATTFLINPCRGSTIQSVDGTPSFDGEYCCYPVTEASDSGDLTCAAGGSSGVGGGEIGGCGGAGECTGSGGGSGTGGVAGTGGGGGGEITCRTCACDFPLSQGGCEDICDENANGTTTPNFCNGAPALAQCAACIETTCGTSPDQCN